MNETFRKQMENTLIWLPEKEVGYYPVKNGHYGDDYFDKYVGYEKTEIGRALNEFRVNLVNSYILKGPVLDIGVGCGTFIKLRRNTAGYDINEKAIAWLKERKLFFNPYKGEQSLDMFRGITFFDSLEHIEDPGFLLEKVDKQYVFVSIPVFKDLEHILASKHFRKDEHYYYFTAESFIKYMTLLGFKLLEKRNDETKCGREDILTFVFKKEQ